MDKTVLIADDLTGALDAGVCLLPQKTQVCVNDSAVCGISISDVDVLCVNAATRHLKPADAASRVRSLVSFARSEGVSKIVKKTDSALRGNNLRPLGAPRERLACILSRRFLLSSV